MQPMLYDGDSEPNTAVHKIAEAMQMTPRFEELLYRSGLTAQGCWDELDAYTRETIIRFGELVVRECAIQIQDAVDHREPASIYANKLRHQFRVKW